MDRHGRVSWSDDRQFPPCACSRSPRNLLRRTAATLTTLKLEISSGLDGELLSGLYLLVELVTLRVKILPTRMFAAPKAAISRKTEVLLPKLRFLVMTQLD